MVGYCEMMPGSGFVAFLDCLGSLLYCILYTELVALNVCLQLAWDTSAHQLILLSDFKLAVDLIHKGVDNYYHFVALVTDVCSLITRDWDVRVDSWSAPSGKETHILIGWLKGEVLRMIHLRLGLLLLRSLSCCCMGM